MMTYIQVILACANEDGEDVPFKGYEDELGEYDTSPYSTFLSL